MRRELRRSKSRRAPWQVLAQQIVVGRQGFPENATSLLAADATERNQQFAAVGAITNKLGYGWNMDSWRGYPPARHRFLQSCAADAANALVLSSDGHNPCAHNACAHNLPGGRDSRRSAGGDRRRQRLLPRLRAHVRQRDAAILAANPELVWCDVTHRGYASTKLTATRADVDWIAFDGVTTAAAGGDLTRSSAEATRDHGVGPWQFG